LTAPIPNFKETLEKIKSRGYWEVIIYPLTFRKFRFTSLAFCKKLIEDNKVRLRGWDYPHISHDYGIRSGTNWVETVTDWDAYKEVWRMYQSGQFHHLFGCREDWWDKVRIFWSEQRYLTPNYGLSVLSTLYTITEIYEFTTRLAKTEIFDDSFRLTIKLNGMKDRRLVTVDIKRSLDGVFICGSEQIAINRKLVVSELLEKRNEFAVDDTVSVFEHFNLFNTPRKVLIEEQDKLLKRLL